MMAELVKDAGLAIVIGIAMAMALTQWWSA